MLTWSRRFFWCFRFSVRSSSTCLKLELILANLACKATTILEECDNKCLPFVDFLWDFEMSCNRAICWFREFRSPLIMYVNSWISAGRSSNRDLRFATEINQRNTYYVVTFNSIRFTEKQITHTRSISLILYTCWQCFCQYVLPPS